MPTTRLSTSDYFGFIAFCLQLQEIFAVANMRDRGLEDLMESVLTFLGENK